MKFTKFINKKMVIFVVLFSAFLYFSGSFNIMREGLTPVIPPNPITFNGNCTGCQLDPNPSNLPCDSGGGGLSAKCYTQGKRANAKDWNCVYNPDFRKTKCTPK
jgi:hypothetical protein